MEANDRRVFEQRKGSFARVVYSREGGCARIVEYRAHGGQDYAPESHLQTNDHSLTYLGVPRRVVVVNKGGHPRAWQQQHNFHISPHLCLRACPVSPLSCLVPRIVDEPLAPPLVLRPRFHARCLARRKRSTHTRRRLRTVTPWIDATNANEPAAEAILSGLDENGRSAIALNASRLPNPRARRRVERRCDAHWPLWRRILNRRRRLARPPETLVSVLCWPLYATRCNWSTMGKALNARRRERKREKLTGWRIR